MCWPCRRRSPGRRPFSPDSSGGRFSWKPSRRRQWRARVWPVCRALSPALPAPPAWCGPHRPAADGRAPLSRRGRGGRLRKHRSHRCRHSRPAPLRIRDRSSPRPRGNACFPEAGCRHSSFRQSPLPPACRYNPLQSAHDGRARFPPHRRWAPAMLPDQACPSVGRNAPSGSPSRPCPKAPGWSARRARSVWCRSPCRLSPARSGRRAPAHACLQCR